MITSALLILLTFTGTYTALWTLAPEAQSARVARGQRDANVIAALSAAGIVALCTL